MAARRWALEFRVLGPLEVRVDDERRALGGPRQHTLLATLLLSSNTVVSTDRLIAVMYGEDPPATATVQVQQAVSALRGVLRRTGGDARIRTLRPGYLIEVAPGELDLDEFRREAEAARVARREKDVEGAAARLRAALAWWRGDALADLQGPTVRRLAQPLDDLRRTVFEELVEANLELGRYDDLVPELTARLAVDPLQERLWCHLLRAHYRSGGRREALEAYDRARRVLADELGIDPGPELAGLHQAILRDDPALGPTVLPLGGTPAFVRPPCPYRGLEPYRPDDAALFFGRRREIEKLVSSVREPGWVTLVGPSGSGKSSLLLAGVLPALGDCTAVALRPGDGGAPQVALAAALRPVLPAAESAADVPVLAERLVSGGLPGVVDAVLAHSGGTRLVVVLDQAEELLVQDEEAVGRFVAALSAPQVHDRLTVLAALRADLLNAVLERPTLGAALGSTVVTLSAMGRAQLREAVLGPVEDLAGVEFQDGLVDRLVDDVGTEAGGLALLGLTLTLLWRDQVEGTLTHRAYDELERVGGVLAHHAEAEWRRHNLADDEPTVRRLFGALVRVQDGEVVLRRVARRAELDDRAWRLAERLSATRLLVVGRGRAVGSDDEEIVELAHDTLIGQWPRLHGWIDDDIEFHSWRETVRADRERWERGGRDPSSLLQGAALTDARNRLAGRAADVTPAEAAFVAESDRRRRHVGRRSRLLRVGLALGLVVVLVVVGLMAQQRVSAARAAADDGSRRLAAQSASTAGRDAARAALLALAADDLAPTAESRAALFAAYRGAAGLSALYSSPGDFPQLMSSTNGRVVAAAGSNGPVTVWVRDPGSPVRTLHATAAYTTAVDLTAEGDALWFLDGDRLTRLDTASGELRELARADVDDRSAVLAVSADGTRLLVQDGVGRGTRIREWDTRTGGLSATTTAADVVNELYAGSRGGVLVQTLAPDTLDYRLQRIDLASGGTTTLATSKNRIAVGRGGDVAVTCTEVGDDLVYERVAGDGVGPVGRAVVPARRGLCVGFGIDSDGTTLAVRAGDYTLTVVDLVSGGPVGRVTTPLLYDSSVQVAGLVASPAGPQVALTDSAHVAFIDADAPETTFSDLQQGFLLPGGTALFGVSGDGSTLRVQAIRAGGPNAAVARPAPFRPVTVRDLRHSPDGTIVADRVADDRVALHRLPALEPLAVVTSPSGPLTGFAVDPRNRLFTRTDHRLSWWDGVSGAPLHHLDLDRLGVTTPGETIFLYPHPDGRRIGIVGTDRPDVTIIDVEDGRVLDRIPVGPDVASVVFQPDTTHMILSRSDFTLEVWDTDAKRREFGPLPPGPTTRRQAVFLDEPGEFMIDDQALNGEELRTYRVGRPDPVTVVDLGTGVHGDEIAADGRTISYRLGAQQELRGVLSLDPAVWREQLCTALGGRDLTAEDRATLPSAPEGPVCR